MGVCRYNVMLDPELKKWAENYGKTIERSGSWVINRAIKSAREKVEGRREPEKPKAVEPDNLEFAFDLFYSAGLVKKSKQQALKAFKGLVKSMKCDPIELANLLATDIRNKISAGEFGIDALHPSTYLNQRRWEDEITNNGRTAPNSRQSASERIAARNEQRYGQAGSGLGMAENGRDLRGTMDKGAGRGTTIDMDQGAIEFIPAAGKKWGESGC